MKQPDSYVNISVATGALLLFGAGQLTMTGFAPAKGQRPGLQTWTGIITAFGGVALVGEFVSLRLIVASLLVLGGIYLTIGSTAKGRGILSGTFDRA